MADTLNGRLTLFLLLAVLVISGVAATTEHLIHEGRVRTRAVERSRLLTRHSLEVIFQGMKHADRETVDEVFSSVGRHDDLKRLRVVAPDGRVAFSSIPGELGERVDVPHAVLAGLSPQVEVSRSDDGVFTTVQERILNDGRCSGCHADDGPILGFFEVRLDATDQVEVLDRGWWTLVTALAVAQLVLFGLLLVFARALILEPLGALLGAMRRVASGRLDERVRLRNPKELAEVGDEFNEMVSKLAEARTELDRRYEDNLARADRLATVGEMATAMAHEIQNPLAGLSGALRVISKDRSMEPRREIVDEMLATIDRLSHSVGDLLDYARPRASSPERIDVRETVRAVAGFLRQQLGPDTGITLVEELHDAPLPAWTDPQQLRQVLLNLALNGIQAMPDGGALTLRCAEGEDGRIRVSISDTGTGIPEAFLDKVFRPFFTTKPRGTGLGLAITRELVERGGGSIRIDTRPGEGTTVHVGLPRHPAEAADRDTAPPALAAGGDR